MFKYLKLAPNFHLILNSSDDYKTELGLEMTSGGPLFETKDEKGLSHLLEHCRVRECEKYTAKEIDRVVFLKDLYKNAWTSITSQGISVAGHKDDLLLMTDLILQFTFKLKISQEVFDNEQSVILKEINERNGNPQNKLGKIINKKLFNPGSKNLIDPVGEINVVASATVENVEKIHKRILNRSHFILSIVGGVDDIEGVLKLINENYIALAKSDETDPIDIDGKNSLKNFKFMPVVSKYAHENCILSIAIPFAISFENKPIRDFLSEMLFFYPNGLFYNRLRTQLGLIYSINYSFDESTQSLFITMVGTNENVPKLIEEIKMLLLNYSDFFDDETVAIIKELYIKRQQIDSDSPHNEANFFAFNLISYNKEYDYKTHLGLINHISSKDLKEVYSQLTKEVENMRIIVISSDKKVKIIGDGV